jgi:hypothetical protein
MKREVTLNCIQVIHRALRSLGNRVTSHALVELDPK